MLFRPEQPDRYTTQEPGLSGDRLLDRVRGTGIAMLVTAALFGLAIVAMISQQEFSLLPSPPVQGAAGGKATVAVSRGAAPSNPGDAVAAAAGIGERFVGFSAPSASPTPSATAVVGPSNTGLGGGRQVGPSPAAGAGPPPSSGSPQPGGDPVPVESEPAVEPEPSSGTPGKPPLGTPPTAAGLHLPILGDIEEGGESEPPTPPLEEVPEPEPAPEPAVPPLEEAPEPEIVEVVAELPAVLGGAAAAETDAIASATS